MKKVLITLTIFFLIFFLNMCIRYIPENHYILVSDNQASEEEKNIYKSLSLKSIRLSEEQSLLFEFYDDLKNDLDLIDSLILRTLSDMYSSNSKKIDYKILEYETEGNKTDKDKFMWIKYGYLFEQVPIVGSERTIIRRIDKLIEKKFLKKQVLNSRNGIKGTFLYVTFDENYSDLTEYDDNLSSEGMTKCHQGV